jgi:predicted amidohydrolase YtcJ
MYWAENRLGAHRMHHAYSYKRILNAAGLVALGTDFPIEHIDPLHTFFAAVDRTDKHNWPENGFLADQKLSAEQALHGMTYGASYSAFGENDYGSITIGQKANFTVLNQNLFDSIQRDRKTCKVEHTIISGDLVYSR